MRRIVALLLIASLSGTVATGPASAGKRQKPRGAVRTVRATYSTPAVGAAVAGDFYAACRHGDGIGCVKITPKSSELFARIKIDDAMGLPVHAFITDVEGNTIIEDLCGGTKQMVFLGSDDEFLVWIFEGSCTDGTPGLATSGTVTAVLSKLP